MRTLTRWQKPELFLLPALSGLFGLRGELDRIFQDSLGTLENPPQAWNPALDVYEDKQNIFVKAEIPGMKKEDIDVSLHDGVLSLSGERKSEQKSGDAQSSRVERFAGRFQRSLTLPGEVQNNKVTAQYVDGILTITLPKAEEAKPKQIQISVG
jgi:HSP20 family protein